MNIPRDVSATAVDEQRDRAKAAGQIPARGLRASRPRTPGDDVSSP